MTRPGLVRADTIDLQNQDAPSTQDHATQSLPPNKDLAKHQAAEIRHVMQDRHSEEETLHDAWHRSTDDMDVQELTDDQLQADHHEPGDASANANANDDSEIDDDMLDDRISSSPSIDDEDIDFDFVYALHTFVATVEGQANATKGDTMVLLDDSNSYWWLVRIVKDNSIGYLPAEHIETPTERLARLNKHRNVDLSAAMLGDSAEKSKNPLKKAMKRRNAKTVQFTAPTFVEASDYDYSSDEEDGMVPEPLYANNTEQTEATSDVKPADAEDDTLANDASGSVAEVARADTPESPIKDINPPVEEPLNSPTLVDKTEAAPLKSSRKGTPRNADSFLKDDGAEPRKITLTPNLLRDDSNGGRSLDNPGSSMESLEKSASPPDRPKDEKKKKEKKPGMLSGLFKSKKKDKKHKNSIDDDSDIEKVSGELARQASAESPKTSYDQRAAQYTTTPEPKSRGKLQKPYQADAPTTYTPAALPPVAAVSPILPRYIEEEQPTSFVAELEGSTVVAPTSREMAPIRQQEHKPAGDTLLGSTTLSSFTNKIRPSDSQDNPKPKKVKKAKTRVELDDFDEVSEEEDHGEDPWENQMSEVEPTRNHAPEFNPITNHTSEVKSMTNHKPKDDLADNHAFMHGTEMIHIPVNLGDDSSSPDEHDRNDDNGDEDSNSTHSPSMIDTPKASPDQERGDANENGYAEDDSTPVASKAQSETTTASGKSTPQPSLSSPPPVRRAPSPPQRSGSATPSISSSARLSPSPASTRSPASTAGTANTWSDASLRAWLDGADNDVRDMLVIIHDKSSVVPVARDHPLMADLFTDESRRLAGLQDELDGLLGNWLARKRSVKKVAT